VNGDTTVFATRNQREVAFVKVAGKLLTLHAVQRPDDQVCERNVKSRERWAGESTTVVLEYRATSSGEESCWYKGRMTVSVGKRTEAITVTGACGC
jgi:hypothetical protein